MADINTWVAVRVEIEGQEPRGIRVNINNRPDVNRLAQLVSDTVTYHLGLLKEMPTLNEGGSE